jgi:hypothetical protein
MINDKKIAIVIPCYKVEKHIAVDDCYPDETAKIIQAIKNPKVILVLMSFRH